MKLIYSLTLILGLSASNVVMANLDDIKEQINKTCERREKEAGRMTIIGMESCIKYQVQSLEKIRLSMDELKDSPRASDMIMKGCTAEQLKKGPDLDFSRLSYCVKSQKEAMYLIKTALNSEKGRDHAETCFIKESERDYKLNQIFYHVGRCLEKNENIIVVRGKTALSEIVFAKEKNMAPVVDGSPKQLLVTNTGNRVPGSNSSCDQAKMKEDYYFACRGQYAMMIEEKRENYMPEKATKLCKCIVGMGRDIASVSGETCQVPKDEIKKMLSDAKVIAACEGGNI